MSARRLEISESDESSSMSGFSDAMADDFEPALDSLFLKRRSELEGEIQKARLVMERGHGDVTAIDEEVFLECVKGSNLVVVHFFHPDFKKCQMLDTILDKLAKKHVETRFVKLNAPLSPFFVKKLKVKTLPTLCVFKEAILQKKLIGFEDYGIDRPVLSMLEKALAKAGGLHLESSIEQRSTILGVELGEDSDWDADW